jgi:hypothetical protein
MSPQQTSEPESPETDQPAPDLRGWPTKAEVAFQFGCDIRAVERAAANGKLRAAFRAEPGRRRITVYHPEDVAREAAWRIAGLAPSSEPVAGTELLGSPGKDLTPTPDKTPARAEPAGIIQALVAALQRPVVQHPAMSAQHPLYLSLEAAVQCTGLSRGYLLARIKHGTLPARKEGFNGGWVVRRTDLEAL